MRTFSELKSFSEELLKQKNTIFDIGQLTFQIYDHNDRCQLNIRTDNYDYPVIKFEERSIDTFTVAVSEKNKEINYSDSKDFKMDDKIEILLDSFPNGQDINVIVGELIKL